MKIVEREREREWGTDGKRVMIDRNEQYAVIEFKKESFIGILGLVLLF